MAIGSDGGPILIVDDYAPLRDACASLLQEAGFHIEVASAGEEALERVDASAPSLVILDVRLPGISGYDVLRRLRDRYGDGLPILIISGVRTEPFDRAAALMVGADDYLVKPFAIEELVARVQALLRRATPSTTSNGAHLTNREHEILGLLAHGKAEREIASELAISRRTAATHIEHILGKLGVHSRAQAVALAYRNNLVGAIADR
jgi:two-component system nitrate/nitrite response regulator NarL